MRNSWIEEFWQLVLIVLGGIILGLLIGYLWQVLTLFLLGYIFRNLYNLQRLIHWLNDPAGVDIPVHFGIWGTIYARVKRMRSGHHRRERRLTDLLGQFQSSAAALPDVTVVLGPQGEIRWFNDAAKTLLKLQSPQDIGRPLVNLFRAPELIGYLDGADFSRPLDIAAPGDNQRKLSVRVTAYGEGEKLLIAQDVTDRYLAEQIRKDFVGNVSHELRTPLTVISGFVENLQLASEQIPKHMARPLELIGEQVARMRSIVEDLLLLMRLETASREVPKERVDIPELINLIGQDGRALADGRLHFEIDIRADLCVEGDAGLLRSAFTNLVVNAIHHTPEDGSVTLSWFLDGDKGVFSVTDTGEGIAPEHIPRLTERFYRVDVGRSRERGGTGLGLALVKHVLQKHGAFLEVESTVGVGSRFSCVFPKEFLIE